MASFWQGICTAAAPTAESGAARHQVLAALRALSRRCPVEALPTLGREEVSSAEVLAALSATPPGRSPGADGIPAELYQAVPDVFAPLLARVFSAVGVTGQVPAGFLDGVISSLPKTGDPTSPANYRPITLLDTDYRTLARVLTRRLLPIFDATIDAEQTAFLRSRRIADNVWLRASSHFSCRLPYQEWLNVLLPPPQPVPRRIHTARVRRSRKLRPPS